MALKLSQLHDSKGERVRAFGFGDTGLVVTLKYLSPAVKEDEAEKVKVRHLSQRRIVEQDLDPREWHKVMAREVLAPRVMKIEAAPRQVVGDDGQARTERSVTVGHIMQIIAMKPEEIEASGGMDAEVEMDRDNIIYLLENCPDLRDWALSTVITVSAFQDKDWLEGTLRKNSEGGAVMSLAT